MSDRIAVRRAFISVSDKTGLVPFAAALAGFGVEIVASGGTARTLADAGVPVVEVSEVTGVGDLLGGRVKTLHPKVFAGILADLDSLTHRADLQRLDAAPFQLVVVNLYPFRETISKPDVTEAEAIEHIDIGGPSLIRAAAKNHRWVGVVTSPDRYDTILDALEQGGLDSDLRRDLAREAFFHTAAYDAAIVGYLEPEVMPERLVVPLRRKLQLRYGENPHQPGGAYLEAGGEAWWSSARHLQGPELSYNNLVDGEAAWRLAWEFDEPAAVVVKHANPAGVAAGDSAVEAFEAAWACDPLSAFGSVVALNRPLDEATAEAMSGLFIEVLIVPAVTPVAFERLAGRKRLRLLETHPPHPGGFDGRRLDAGFVLQPRDAVDERRDAWTVQTSREPTEEEWRDLEFAWVVAAHPASNTVVVASERAAVGVGSGDQSRIGAVERALRQAGDRAEGAVAASDGFFPFRDGIDRLAEAGVTAVVEPGGSKRDEEVIAAAEQLGMALVFTGRRHFH